MTEAEWLACTTPANMIACLYGRESLDRTPRAVAGQPSDRKLRLAACAAVRRHWGLLTDSRARNSVEVAERFADGDAIPYELRCANDAANDLLRHIDAPDPETVYDAKAAVQDASACSDRVMLNGIPDRLGLAFMIEPPFCPELPGLLREVIGNPFRPVSLPYRCRDCGLPCAPPAAGYYCVRCGAEQSGRTPWLTPNVLSLANAAYHERTRQCPACKGARELCYADIPKPAFRPPSPDEPVSMFPPAKRETCRTCWGEGSVEDVLDFARLAVLSDAMEEVGCDSVVLLDHLRSPVPHVRGCWALDLILGKE